MAEIDAILYSVLVACRAADQTLANRLFDELDYGTPFNVGIYRIAEDPTIPAFFGSLWKAKPGSDRFTFLKNTKDGIKPPLVDFDPTTTQIEVDTVFDNLQVRYKWYEPNDPIDARAFWLADLASLNYAPVQGTTPPAQPLPVSVAAARIKEWLQANGGTNAKIRRDSAALAIKTAIGATNAQAKTAADAAMIELFGIGPGDL